jgi:hypothetical protein
MEGLISTNNQHNLIDIYIILQPQIAEKTLRVYVEFSKIHYIMDHKTIFQYILKHLNS